MNDVPVTWAEDLLGLFLPRCCAGCDRPLMRAEERLCLHCLNDLPRTRFHDQEDNKVDMLFWGKVPLQAASAFLHFSHRGRVQRMLHQLKYKSDRALGRQLGHLMALDLMASQRFSSVDALAAVPLHPAKERQRGYNQSCLLTEGMAQTWGIAVMDGHLRRSTRTTTQTRKGRWDRWMNVGSAFEVHRAEALRGRHVLLVDDVITTGSTLEACAAELLKVPDVRISVFAAACA